MVTKNTDGRPYHVLLVEGNVGDVELTIVVLTESKFQSTIDVVGDGDLAMAYVRRTGEYANAPRPDIILLDFNLPTMDGFEVLTELSADNDLGRIPVMILTGNEVEDSVLDSFGIPASRFSRKPIDVSRFDRLLDEASRNQLTRLFVAEADPKDVGSPDSLEGKRWWWPF
jgi:chemotaxis family two-component system response regulator Rcp1